MVYTFNALDQVVACGEDEGTIVNIQALEEFNSSKVACKIFLG
jgi:hypothetical protein